MFFGGDGWLVLIIIFAKLRSCLEVTRILSAIEGGDPHAEDQLLPLVYDGQAGRALDSSRPVAHRNWKYARAWLREALEK